jgi:5'(3')-deoxyribonucleotidase
MARKKIAVDIDDVLAASAAEWVNFSNQQWGTSLTVDDYHEDWAKMWQVDRETESQRARQIYASGMIREFPPDKIAKEVLTELAKDYDLVIATSRVYKVHPDTLAWLDRHYGGIFKEVHMSGIYDRIADGALPTEGQHNLTKGQLVAEIGADYLIDDQPKHCLAAAEAGLEAILFGDYKWNKILKALPPGVTFCRDWLAVREYFSDRD